MVDRALIMSLFEKKNHSISWWGDSDEILMG